MDLLIPSTGLLFWMCITFFIVYALLRKFGFPAIVGMVNERKQFIDDSLRKAQEANEKLANIQKEGESILREARDKPSQMLKEATATRDAIIEKAQTQAKGEAARLIADAKAQIEAEKASAIREIRAEMAQLYVQVAEKVVRKNLADDASQMELIDKLLDEVSVGK